MPSGGCTRAGTRADNLHTAAMEGTARDATGSGKEASRSGQEAEGEC